MVEIDEQVGGEGIGASRSIGLVEGFGIPSVAGDRRRKCEGGALATIPTVERASIGALYLFGGNIHGMGVSTGLEVLEPAVRPLSQP